MDRWLQIAAMTALNLVMIVTSTSAELLVRDLRIFGDGLLTYDTVNRREWLDLTEAVDFSLEDIHSATAIGGELAGFRLATFGDVDELTKSVPERYLWIDYRNSYESTLIEILNPPESALYNRLSTAYVRQASTADELTEVFISQKFALACNIRGCDFRGGIGVYESTIASYGTPPGFIGETGYWLYRSAVPEPSTLTILAATLFIGLPLFERRAR